MKFLVIKNVDYLKDKPKLISIRNSQLRYNLCEVRFANTIVDIVHIIRAKKKKPRKLKSDFISLK